ncbi:MAG TPA: NAD(P)H-binding protein [Pseudomonadales bacterium]|nr:NAD(P)H-binding protein [Pseudomonadales bacterium]
MKVTIFGSTGDLGRECLQQCLDAGHDITVLVRNPNKLPASIKSRIAIIQGDALSFEDVRRAIPSDTNAILFAIGVDEKTSPLDLCTDVTRHILHVMRNKPGMRLVWCGGGSNILPDDVVTLGSRFVRFFSEKFLAHRHGDKEHQIALLEASKDVTWIGIRPLQMKKGSKRGQYRLGFHAYSGLSKITFADCAHAMVRMLQDDTWIGKAPIIQY